MTTARDLINDIYRKINILGAGSDLTSEEANDGLRNVNQMLALWSTQKALIYAETKEAFPLTGATEYTIGDSQDFNTTVPREITSAYVTISGVDYPIQIIDEAEYADISDKDQTGIPTRVYFDSNYPTAKLYFWPVGDTNTTFTMFSVKPLTGFSTLDTDFTMPPEYEAAIVHNGAVWIAPEFEKEASSTVKIIAKQSLDWIKAQNKKNNKGVVKTDSAFLSRGRFDIYTGTYR